MIVFLFYVDSRVSSVGSGYPGSRRGLSPTAGKQPEYAGLSSATAPGPEARERSLSKPGPRGCGCRRPGKIRNGIPGVPRSPPDAPGGENPCAGPKDPQCRTPYARLRMRLPAVQRNTAPGETGRRSPAGKRIPRYNRSASSGKAGEILYLLFVKNIVIYLRQDF